jgi:hypothetical protein
MAKQVSRVAIERKHEQREQWRQLERQWKKESDRIRDRLLLPTRMPDQAKRRLLALRSMFGYRYREGVT